MACGRSLGLSLLWPCFLLRMTSLVPLTKARFLSAFLFLPAMRQAYDAIPAWTL